LIPQRLFHILRSQGHTEKSLIYSKKEEELILWNYEKFHIFFRFNKKVRFHPEKHRIPYNFLLKRSHFNQRKPYWDNVLTYSLRAFG